MREKKEKKPKSSKKHREEPEAEAAQDVPPSEEAVEVDGEEKKEKKSKKRKREAIPEELEIDVLLPEPPSKKALRKAKKSKTAGTSDTEAGLTTDGADTEGEANGKPSKSSKASKPMDTSSKKDDEKERRTEHSIWIGNLPWTATKQDLRDFLCDQASLSASQIVRLHMPAPDKKVARDTKGRPPFTNRGFAYVDFDGAEALFAVLQVSETPFYGTGRNLLIKNAKSFEGRPEEHATAAAGAGEKAKGGPGVGNPQKPPSKRVFVGNLAFEITKEDLETHFGQCGEVEGIHMATFEDSGKCKGYAWVTFATLEAAEAAVRGWIIKEPEEEEDEDDEEEDEEKNGPEGDGEGDGEDASAKTKRKKKGRKWFVNRLIGRELKREYAEDASVRYKKRYGGGGEKRRQDGNSADAGDAPAITEVDGAQRNQQNTSSHDRRREQRKAGRPKVDARTIAPGAALARAQRSTGAITESKGSKVTFD